MRGHRQVQGQKPQALQLTGRLIPGNIDVVEAKERAVEGVPTLEGRSDSCTAVHAPAQQNRDE